MPNWQVALIIWVVLGVTIAGLAVAVVLIVPQLAEHSVVLIPSAAAAGFIAALFASMVIARQINPART